MKNSILLSSELGDHWHHRNQQLDHSLQERLGLWLVWQHDKQDQAKQGRVWIGSHCNVVDFNSTCKHVNLYFCKRI